MFEDLVLIEYYFVLISCIGFLASLVPGRHRKYAGIVGWTFIVLFLFAELPYYFSLNNFLYPVMAVLSVPFLFITARYLMAEDDRVMHLTRAAAVAFLIYAPFEYIPVLGNWLIGIVVGQVTGILDVLQFPVTLAEWNIISRNSFRVEIILACTGIQSIAIMLGVAAAGTDNYPPEDPGLPPDRPDHLYPEPPAQCLCHYRLHRTMVSVLPVHRQQRRVRIREFLLGT